MNRYTLQTILGVFCLTATLAVAADFDRDNRREANGCSDLPDHSALKAALITATQTEASGLNNQMWGTIVDRDGVVCVVAFSGVNRGAQWPGSRVISAQKANTANAFSLDTSSSSNGSGQPGGLALSTANLYSANQPGGSSLGCRPATRWTSKPRTQAPPQIMERLAIRSLGTKLEALTSLAA